MVPTMAGWPSTNSQGPLSLVTGVVTNSQSLTSWSTSNPWIIYVYESMCTSTYILVWCKYIYYILWCRYLCSNQIWHDGMCAYIFIYIYISFIIPTWPRHWFPGLLRCEGFLREFVTPIVKVSKGTEVVSFFTLPVACWKQNFWCSCVGSGAFIDMYIY